MDKIVRDAKTVRGRNCESDSDSEVRLVGVPSVRRSVRQTRGLPPQRYSSMARISSLKKLPKSHKRSSGSALRKCSVSAIDDHISEEIHDDTAQGKEASRIVQVEVHHNAFQRESTVKTSEKHKSDNTVGERARMRENECDLLKDEIAVLRQQIADMRVSEKEKSFRPVTSTPHKVHEKGAFTTFDPSSTSFGHVRSHIGTNYLSAVGSVSSANGSEHDYQHYLSTSAKLRNVNMKKCKQTHEVNECSQLPPQISPMLNYDQMHPMAQSQWRNAYWPPVDQQQHGVWPPNQLSGHAQFQQQQPQQPNAFQQQQPQHQPNAFQHQQSSHQPNWSPQYQQQQRQHNPFVHQQQQIDQQVQSSDFHRYLLRKNAQDLPRFDGNPEDWLLFSTQYWRTTKAGEFSADENLVRLQRALHGQAKEAVKALLLLPQCVDEVMRTLHERFGRDEYIIKGLINRTRRISSFRDDQPHNLIEFATMVNNMVVTVKSLGRLDYLENPQLLEDIESKLPPMLLMLWSNSVVGLPRYTLNDLNNWLQQQTRAISHRVLPKDDRRKYAVHKVFVANEDASTSLGPKIQNSCVCCKQQCVSLAKCAKFSKKSVEDRFEFVKKSFVCFSCLNPGHTSARCKRSQRCGVVDCRARHHTLLHNPQSKSVASTRTVNNKKSAEPIVSSEGASSDEREICATIPSIEKRTLLKVVPVTLRFGDVEVKTNALLDSGSTVTLLRTDIARDLCATGPVMPVCIQWGDGTESSERDSQMISVHIKGSYDGARQYLMNGVKTVQRVPKYTQSVNREQLTEKWPYLRGIPFAEYNNAQIGILIGEDNAFIMAPQRVVKFKPYSPIATKTPIGWIISGKVSETTTSEVSFVHHTCDEAVSLDELHRIVKHSFAMDEFGIKSTLVKGRSREDVRALALMEETAVRMPGHRWEIGLLWRDPNAQLPESRNMALMRLQCLERRLDRDAILRAAYSEKISEYIEKGYFVRSVDNSQTQQRQWFLPHFPVTNPNKPKKLRIVFDAAAKSHGRSLNDFLMTGPDLLKALPGVLFRFRQRRVGFVGDIKEMYHRVAIREKDQCSQLILWRGEDRQRAPDVYRMTAMTFGASCSPSAAMFVKDKNAQEFAHTFPEASKVIIENHYVDDCLCSTDDDAAAAKLIREVCWVHSQGGFEIRNWACSSKAVLETIPEEKRSAQPKQIMCDQMERTLGIWWDPITDTFSFRLKKQLDSTSDAVPTKRRVLKDLMTIYDPLGMLAHVLIRGKIILQYVWKSGIGWDDELTSALATMWRTWLQDLVDINKVQIPRCYSASLSFSPNVQLHIFCDASEQAYCAVAYFRIQLSETIETALVIAKTRVAPLKTSTVPRLELQAALIGSRIASSVVAEHEIKPHRIVMWSDSRTVLAWVRAEDRRFRQYVAQRVGEILEHTNKTDWRWVPTMQNVADDATRMTSSLSYEPSGRWYSGPSFLKMPEQDWPQETIVGASNAELEVIDSVYITNIDPFLFKFERYSTLGRLIRVVAWMLRFFDRVKLKKSVRATELSVVELDRAEIVCLRAVQRESFPEEVRLISSGVSLGKSSRLYKLCPQIGLDGLLRVGGRLEFVSGDRNYINPIIIDGRHQICMLLLRKFHNRYDHQNDATVLNELRQKYWAIGARRELKRMKQTCAECNIRKAKPEQQLMGQLPRVRLEYGVPAFTRTGVDYFGPIEVAVGRRREKRYGVLFTCMTSRAVHLDAAASLSTDSFLMAWRRFVARRGVPKEMLSDNGTNFRGADTEMAKAIKELDNGTVQAATASRGVTWTFIPPGSPHFGGCWERLVRSIKNSLSITLKNRRPPSDELLQTLLVEAENVVNSRPLTEVQLDHLGDDVITPNHLLIGRSSSDAPIGKFNDTDLLLRKQWRAAQRLADVFWATWVRSYLPTLTLRSKWHKQGRKLSVGDVVLIADANETRNSWPKGIIERVYPGKDGIVRVVDVRTASGTCRRPAHKICVLVVADSSANGSGLPETSNTERENVTDKTATHS